MLINEATLFKLNNHIYHKFQNLIHSYNKVKILDLKLIILEINSNSNKTGGFHKIFSRLKTVEENNNFNSNGQCKINLIQILKMKSNWQMKINNKKRLQKNNKINSNNLIPFKVNKKINNNSNNNNSNFNLGVSMIHFNLNKTNNNLQDSLILLHMKLSFNKIPILIKTMNFHNGNLHHNKINFKMKTNLKNKKRIKPLIKN